MTTEPLTPSTPAPIVPPVTARPPDVAGPIAIVLLLIGTASFLALPAQTILAAPVGLVFAWLSRRWRVRNKVIATVFGVAFVVLPFVLAATIAKNWGFGALGLVLLWPVGALLVGLYLLFTRRSDSAG